VSDDAHSVIKALIDKAATTNDKDAALKACKSIRALGVTLLVPAGKTLPGLSGARVPAEATSPAKVGRKIVTKFGGRCWGCKGTYEEGDEIVWVPADAAASGKSESYCLSCGE
jgi:hypothetical protein